MGCCAWRPGIKQEFPVMSQTPLSTVGQDPFDLERFLKAQAGVYGAVVDELRSGQKRSHWMWFIFPQFQGLGSSFHSQRYAIKSLAEARAYLEHPVLGPRLRECTRTVNGLEGRSAWEIFGDIDEMKFRSSMTLFELASGAPSEFTTALEKYYAGQRDMRTLELVGRGAVEIDTGSA
jgi:uncharacterized protein (DUF1810 family)